MDLRQDRSRLYAYFGGKTDGPPCATGSSAPKKEDSDAREPAAASEVACDRVAGGHWPGQDAKAQLAAASGDVAAPEPPARVKREPSDSPKGSTWRPLTPQSRRGCGPRPNRRSSAGASLACCARPA